MFCTGPSAFIRSFDAVDDATIRSSRLAGSSSSVASSQRINPTALPASLASSEVRSDTGTIATSGASGSASSSRR